MRLLRQVFCRGLRSRARKDRGSFRRPAIRRQSSWPVAACTSGRRTVSKRSGMIRLQPTCPALARPAGLPLHGEGRSRRSSVVAPICALASFSVSPVRLRRHGVEIRVRRPSANPSEERRELARHRHPRSLRPAPLASSLRPQLFSGEARRSRGQQHVRRLVEIVAAPSPSPCREMPSTTCGLIARLVALRQ